MEKAHSYLNLFIDAKQQWSYLMSEKGGKGGEKEYFTLENLK